MGWVVLVGNWLQGLETPSQEDVSDFASCVDGGRPWIRAGFLGGGRGGVAGAFALGDMAAYGVQLVELMAHCAGVLMIGAIFKQGR